ncbi:MAG: DUF5723 family protein [Bacteroidales bacterium]|nr:DUF5723 family protein [Bacteroidales bacterium]
MKQIVRFTKSALVLSLIMLIFTPEVKAQNFSPYFGDNYAGISGVYNNPASIANSRYIVDITLLGGSSAFTNNYFSAQRKFMFNQMNFNANKRNAWRELWFEKPWLQPYGSEGDNSYVLRPLESDRMYDGISETEIQLLNFMVAINPRMSIGVTERIRSITNVDNASWGLMETFFYTNPLADLGLINNGAFRFSTATWNELGLTFASQIYDGGEHFIKGGISVKMMQGLSSAYVASDNVSLQFDTEDNVTVNGDIIYGVSDGLNDNIQEINENKETGEYGGSSDIRYSNWGTLGCDYMNAVTNNFLRHPFDSQYWKNLSFGLDLGFVYEWRPDYEDYLYEMDGETGLVRNDLNKYRLKLSVAVTDIPLTGGIKYVRDANLAYSMVSANKATFATSYFRNALESTENLNTATEETFGSSADASTTAVSDTIYKVVISPTINLSIDFNLGKNFYVNLGGYIPFSGFTNNAVTELESGEYNVVKVHTNTAFNLTPRYERRWFGVSIPLTYQLINSDQMQVGLGLRLGPVWIGSNTLFSNIATKYWEGIDLCAAVKVPIMYNAPKDKDNDKVSDKKDQCPEDKGTWATQGCPDTDGDGIVDSEDECPYEPGLVEFKGCPDRDGDGIIDSQDECPDDPGLPEYNGCPDRDGDGIPDHKDLCPDEPGTVERKGCPESMFIIDTDGDGIPDDLDDCPLLPGTIANNGCPEEAIVYSIDYATVNFDINKFNIKTPAEEILDKIIYLTKNNKATKIEIIGHCDNTGNDRINDPLSVNRAESVKKYLADGGVNKDIISTEGRGSHDPIATNSTVDGRTKNRRVDITIDFIKKQR